MLAVKARYHHHYKKLEVDLNVITVALWVQAVAHLLLAWFRVTSLVQSSFLAKHEFPSLLGEPLGSSFVQQNARLYILATILQLR